MLIPGTVKDFIAKLRHPLRLISTTWTLTMLHGCFDVGDVIEINGSDFIVVGNDMSRDALVVVPSNTLFWRSFAWCRIALTRIQNKIWQIRCYSSHDAARYSC